jgi:hypothetical protein
MGDTNMNGELDDQLQAMAEQSIDDDSSGDLPEDDDSEDGRKGPRANRVKWETLVARYSAMIADWQKDASPHSAAICEVLSLLNSEAIAGRDAPREEKNDTGPRYVGQMKDGSRKAFRSTSKPTAKGFVNFVKVWGPYSSEHGQNYDVSHDTQLSRRNVVYDRAAK